MRLTLRRLTRNGKLKLASFALAVLLWSVVSAEQISSRWITVRIEPSLRTPGFAVAGTPTPASVQVRFTAPGRELWELALHKPTLVLPIRYVAPGGIYALDPQMVRVPAGVVATAQDVRPATARVELRPLASREVPVRARVGPRSLRRYVLPDTLTVDPARVRITGPPELVDRVDAISTRTFEIAPRDSAFVRRVELDGAGLSGLTLAVPSVQVAGRAEVRAERSFPSVPVVAPAGYVASPARVRVHVTGPERAVRSVSGSALRVETARPPAGRSRAGTAAVRAVGLPPGLATTVVPERVRLDPVLRSVTPPDTLASRAAPDTADAEETEPR